VDDPRDIDSLGAGDGADAPPSRRPALGPTVLTVLLPVILMLLRAVGELTLDEGNGLRTALDILGTPVIALLIVAAGGGFKQVLVDSGVGELVGELAAKLNLSVLILGWLIAVGIRLATGSATVATITAAGLVAPIAGDLDKPSAALLVLAIGAGSVFFSHVNDAGFWLVKEYFGMTVGQTINTWSVMETIISVVGLICVLILSIFV
jgi:GntP family gluconate:H+ symporter